MKAQKRVKENPNQVIKVSSMSSQKDSFSDRRQSEMKRRFGILQSRRGYLERELKAVKTGLFKLDQQMQHYSAYMQMFKRDWFFPNKLF